MKRRTSAKDVLFRYLFTWLWLFRCWCCCCCYVAEPEVKSKTKRFFPTTFGAKLAEIVHCAIALMCIRSPLLRRCLSSRLAGIYDFLILRTWVVCFLKLIWYHVCERRSGNCTRMPQQFVNRKWIQLILDIELIRLSRMHLCREICEKDAFQCF